MNFDSKTGVTKEQLVRCKELFRATASVGWCLTRRYAVIQDQERQSADQLLHVQWALERTPRAT